MFILSYMSNKPRLDVTISVCLQHCETKFKLFKNIQPNAVIRTSQGKEATDEKIIVKVDSNLYFPGVERFRSALNKAAVGHRSQHLIIDLSNLKAIDYSSLKVSFKNVVSLKTMRNSKRNCTALRLTLFVQHKFMNSFLVKQMLKSVANGFRKSNKVIFQTINAKPKIADLIKYMH